MTKTKRSHALDQGDLVDEEFTASSSSHTKKPKFDDPAGVWANLDLVLSLQNKQLPLDRQIEIAFNFASHGAFNNQGPVKLFRLVGFLGDWVQSLIISSDQKNKIVGPTDPCFDYRCWDIFKFCLKNSTLTVSSNLLRPLARLLRHVSSVVGSGDDCRLFELVVECLNLILTSNSRAFYNAGGDLWISCALEIVGLSRMVVYKIDGDISYSHDVLLGLCCMLLDHFSSFLRFLPNPKNIFRAFVDRLLEPSLELLVLLHLKSSSGKYERLLNLLKIVEDVLLNGLFHPVHIGGYLSSKTSILKEEVKEAKGINESYHRHFFRKLENTVSEKRATALGGFGYLLRLYVSRVKAQKEVVFPSKNDFSLGNGGEDAEDAQQTSKPLFEVFVQFMEPLVHEFKRFCEEEFVEVGEVSEVKLVEAHCLLKSVNETLSSFIHEKIYVRTEDTSEQMHFNYLKGVYDMIISVAGKIYLVWLAALNKNYSSVEKMIPPIAKEVFVSVGHLLEIEYRVFEDDLTKEWLMMLSYMALNLSTNDRSPSSLLNFEVSELGCRLVKVYSELRQVNNVIFALCRALRLFSNSTEKIAPGIPQFIVWNLPSKARVRSVTTLLSSQTFRSVISDGIKSVPEGQANGCIQQLNSDIDDTLEWMRSTSDNAGGVKLAENEILPNSIVDLNFRSEILGRFLSEIYTIVLDSLNSTITNSKSVVKSFKRLVQTIKPCFSLLCNHNGNNLKEFVFSVTGKELPIFETAASNRDMALESIAYILAFFFRLYSSCRSLYRQLISLTPPAKNTSKDMGYLLDVCCGMDWAGSVDFFDEGYFSWICEPSISLADMIGTISKNFFWQPSATVQTQMKGIFYGHAPLLYSLYVMAIQRLVTLNKKLKAYEFLLGKGNCSIEMQVLNNDDRHKLSRKLKRLITVSREEASELVNFITSCQQKIAIGRQCISCYEEDTSITREMLSEHKCTWDFSFCSLDENSVSIAIWWLLCENTDIWCVHADKKMLKEFVANLLYSLPFACDSVLAILNRGTPVRNCKISMPRISLELLSDTVFYEQSGLCKQLRSRICDMLKQSLSPLIHHSRIYPIDFDSLPDKALDMLEESLDSSQSEHVLINSLESADSSRESFSSASICKSLFDLLCQMPGSLVNARSFRVYATYILNIESLLLSILLDHHSEYFHNSYGLFDLFLTCRRTLKYLVMKFSEEKSGALDSSSFFLLFGTSFTIPWLVRSVMKIVRLLSVFRGEKDAMKVNNMTYGLIEHTSDMLLIVCKHSVVGMVSSTLSNKDFLLEMPDGPKKQDMSFEANRFFDSSQAVEYWKPVENIVNILKEQVEILVLNLTDIVLASKMETAVTHMNWNNLSLILSCIQGFLRGLDSAVEKVSDDFSTKLSLSKLTASYYVSRLFNHFILFEDFVGLCTDMVLISHTPKTKTTDDSCNFDTSLFYGNLSSIPAYNAAEIFRELYKIDFCDLKHLNMSLLQKTLKGESSDIAFTLRQLFIAAAAILKLKSTCQHSGIKELSTFRKQFGSCILGALVKTSYVVLRQTSEMVGRLDPSCFIWLDGIIKYIEVVGLYLQSAEPVLSENLYSHLIEAHLRALGKSICQQGRSSTLFSHGQNYNIKMSTYQMRLGDSADSPDYGNYDIQAFRVRLRASLRNLVRTPLKLHLLTAIKAVERALVGLHEGCTVVYEISTGNPDGGKVSHLVAAAIDSFDLVLETVSGRKRVMKRHITGLVDALFNIILHAQSPSIFYSKNLSVCINNANPDQGTVILMCMEILTKVAGDHDHILEASHVSQCLHVPASLFGHFHQLRVSYEIDSYFSVDLFAVCCKLLSTILRHRKSEASNCTGVLENSVNALLKCFETVDSNLVSKGYFAWDLEEAIRCASFFRRIFEEIRHQKDIFARHAAHFLSSYVCIYAGYGPYKTGIKREIDETLRPGVYSLIDICTPADLQQLHTVLSVGPCRSTLASLQHDYKLNFRFEGKI